AIEAEPETAEDPELLLLGEPARAVRRVANLRRLIAELRGRVLDPEVAGHPGHVDVAVSGDDPIAHRAPRLLWVGAFHHGAGTRVVAPPAPPSIFPAGSMLAARCDPVKKPRTAGRSARGGRPHAAASVACGHVRAGGWDSRRARWRPRRARPGPPEGLSP